MENPKQVQTKKETMTSRERVKKAVNHEPVDRVPIDLGMHYATGISAFAYWHLLEHFGIPTDHIEIVDVVEMLARVDEAILKRFHCDCILLHPGWSSTHRWNPRPPYEFILPSTARPIRNSQGDWEMFYKKQYLRMPANGLFFDGAWPDFEDRPEDEVIRCTALEAERIYKETDYYTMYMYFSAYFQGSPDWLCKMLLDPKEILENNQRILEKELKRAGKVIDSMGDYIQAVCIASDLGGQNAPLCSPSVYADLCAPFIEKFCSFIHQNSDLKVFLHSCGSVRSLIPIFIQCGVDILNPVQVSAKGMDPAELKKEYGDKITFWGGGCDTQRVMSVGTPQQVSDNVRELIRTFKKGSGYVFTQVHNIMGDVSPEKIIAMFDTAYEESFY
jgi:uroporphyrinogen decarboxylase